MDDIILFQEILKGNVKIKSLEKGQLLYRFVDKEPQEVKCEMTNNKGQKGRCNKYRDVYYCSISLSGMRIEQNTKKIKGSIITAEVIDTIELSCPTKQLLMQFRGRTCEDKPDVVHSILSFVGLDYVVDYDFTNDIAEHFFKITSDGIFYPSKNSIDCNIGGFTFVFDDNTAFSNIALTEKGFSKIKLKKPIVYWNGYTQNN